MELSNEISTVRCSELPNPTNGRVDQQGNRPGDRALYACTTGYELVGQSLRTCQNNGQWSGEAPSCESEFFLFIMYVTII